MDEMEGIRNLAQSFLEWDDATAPDLKAVLTRIAVLTDRHIAAETAFPCYVLPPNVSTGGAYHVLPQTRRGEGLTKLTTRCSI